MVIIVKERVYLWKQIWSWPVVGGILFLLLSSGVTFSTTDHSLLADAFYSASAVLFIVKFLTWEDARQLDKPKRNKSYGLAIGITLVVLCTIILGNHKLNASHQVAPGVIQSPSAKLSPETITPNAGAKAKDENQQKQPAQGPKPSIPSSKSNQQSKGQAKRPTETATGPIEIRQQSSGPNSPNVAQIGNNNQAIINPQPQEKNSEEEKKRRREIREALGDLMRRGVVLRDRVFSDPPDASGKLNEESQKWFDETRKYIIANLGRAYDTQFITVHVEPLARGVPHERESLWHGLSERIEALSKFIDELK